MLWLGLLIGGIIGSGWGFRGTLLGALLGALVGIYLRQSAARTTVPPGAAGDGESAPATMLPPAPALPVRKGGTGAGVAPAPADTTPAVAAAAPPAVRDPLSAWLTGGNALTRVGVVILFFGIAFLLRYLAEIVVIPLEWRLVGVGAVGLLLIGAGLVLARTRAGYGLSLQGAGAGVLYLTTFAAFRLYHVLPPMPGLVSLALIAAATVALAIRADAQALAGLAVAGGFLAPVLTDVIGEPALLFSYFAILNAATFALAWLRPWRALNLLGFVFTFVLGSLWAYRYYQPRYFATVEPFLILFFAFYVAIAILYARRGRFEARAPVDGLLVFGVPLVSFAIQVALVHGLEYGAAWSAAALALFYGALFVLFRSRTEAGLALLVRTFLALAAIFAIVAIPLVFDTRVTAALWAVAAAAAFWLGVRQGTPLLRGFALLVQLGAGAVFLWSHTGHGDDPLFANAFFVGAILVALSGITTAAVADHAGDRLPPPERGFIALLLLWGAAWWLLGGAFELERHLDRVDMPHAALAWVELSAAAALGVSRAMRWARLLSVGIVLLPTMVVAAAIDLHLARTTLENFGWLVWPLAWIVQWVMLYLADAPPRDGTPFAPSVVPTQGQLYFAHATAAIGLTAQVAWETSEWIDRVTPPGTVWLACAAVLPLIAFLLLAHSLARMARWPLIAHRDAYVMGAGGPIAALTALWFATATITSPGTASPLPCRCSIRSKSR